MKEVEEMRLNMNGWMIKLSESDVEGKRERYREREREKYTVRVF